MIKILKLFQVKGSTKTEYENHNTDFLVTNCFAVRFKGHTREKIFKTLKPKM